MAQGREIMTDWVVEALQQIGGRGTILDISRRVWDRHEPDIRAAGDLLYEWQYELRWAGDILRRDGVLRPTEDTPKGAAIPGGGGLRKLRWRAGGRGKRGGLRLIYFWDPAHHVIYLLRIYAKSAQEDLTPAQLRILRRIVKEDLR